MRKFHVIDADAIVEVLCDGNPKRPHSRSPERFDRYLDQGTVAECLRSGVTHQDLVSDLEHGYIKIVPPTRPAADGLAEGVATMNAASPRAE